jgi:hypothetical protein
MLWLRCEIEESILWTDVESLCRLERIAAIPYVT